MTVYSLSSSSVPMLTEYTDQKLRRKAFNEIVPVLASSISETRIEASRSLIPAPSYKRALFISLAGTRPVLA